MIMENEVKETERKKAEKRNGVIRVIAAVMMFVIGLMCLLYPIIAKRYNEYLALKANAQYAQHSVGYDEDGDIVLIP